MRALSNTWQTLWANANSHLETIAVVDGVSYEKITAPTINRAMVQGALTIGSTISALCQFSMLPESNVIPKAAEVIIKMRLANGTTTSEWVNAGTFFISRRSEDPVTGRLTLECYDAMLKANANYPLVESSDSDFPMDVDDMVTNIAAIMGVEIDSRTWDVIPQDGSFQIPYPTGLTMQRILGYIGGVYGGNWIITPENKLRFVPLYYSVPAAFDSASCVEVEGIINSIAKGETGAVTGVRATIDREPIMFGDESGYVVKTGVNPYFTEAICLDLSEKFIGLNYSSFNYGKAVYNPAAELGDFAWRDGEFKGVLCSELATLGAAYRANISCPDGGETEDEYPYKGLSDQVDDIDGELRELVTITADKADITELEAVQAIIDNLSVSDIKTGIIRSYDYEVEEVPFIYPATTLYPGTSVYPSNGQNVISGFAINFAEGVIYGAFYYNDIEELRTALLGYLSRAGGEMTGDIDFGESFNGVKWSTLDGTTYAIRAHPGSNILQIVQIPAGEITAYRIFAINASGEVTLNAPLPIGSGGTNATTAAGALTNLGGVPTTRTVNGKALSSNITLQPSDVGAVPTGRTVNGKALSSNITLNAADVGALADTALDVSSPSSSYCTLSSGTTANLLKVRQSGKMVSVFIDFASIGNNIANAGIFKVESAFIPAMGNYIITPIYDSASPYLPVGTMWIDGNGIATKYGTMTKGYVSYTYMVN